MMSGSEPQGNKGLRRLNGLNGLNGLKLARHFKVLEVLSEADRTAYEEFLRAHPASTVDDRVEWLADKGYTFSRNAVWRHGRNFQELRESLMRSAELAKAFGSMAREGNAATEISEASLARFQQIMLEKLFQVEAEGELASGDLVNLSIALKTAVGTKQQIEKLKAEYAARQKEAVAAAEKTAAAGAGGAAVVDAIKVALGFKEAA